MQAVEHVAVPLLVAGSPDEGSNGDAVLAPLIPHTTRPMLAGPEVLVSVIVSPESAVDAIAHHSLSVTPAMNVFLSAKLRCPCTSVGVLKGTAKVVARTIITSFGLLVPNGVTEQDVRAEQEFEAAPSTDRLGVL